MDISESSEIDDILENKKHFLRAMHRCRSIPCPAGTARAEDPLWKAILAFQS